MVYFRIDLFEIIGIKSIGTQFALKKDGEVCLINMKGKMLTSWSLIWLLATVFFVAGGALNLFQRANHDLPPTDGVIWSKKLTEFMPKRFTPDLPHHVPDLLRRYTYRYRS